MSERIVIIVLIVIVCVLLLWAEYYRREVDRLREEVSSLRTLLDYRKK